MQTVVVAGGYGTRMKPFFGELPKSLAPIGATPFLILQLNWLKEASTLHFCLGHKADLIDRFLENNKPTPPVTQTHESLSLGVIGSMYYALPELNGTFAVLLGDVLPKIPYKELIRISEDQIKAGQSIMFLAPSRQTPGQEGNINMNNNLITEYCKSSSFQGKYVDIGFWILQKDQLEEFGHLSTEEVFFEALIQRNLLVGKVVHLGSWEVGSFEGWTDLCRNQASNMEEGMSSVEIIK